jgi:hypothetical protein
MKATTSTRIEAALSAAQQRIDEMIEIPGNSVGQNEETRRVMDELRQLSTDALRVIMVETVLALSRNDLFKPEANERLEERG